VQQSWLISNVYGLFCLIFGPKFTNLMFSFDFAEPCERTPGYGWG